MLRLAPFTEREIRTAVNTTVRLIETAPTSEVMEQEPYKSARRVFWIMDNCSAHRGQKAVDRFRAKWPNGSSPTLPSTPSG